MSSATHTKTAEGRRSAIVGEGLYLLNLLLPLLPMLLLSLLYLRHRNTQNNYLYLHLLQPLLAASISSTFFLLGNLYVLSANGYRSIEALVIFVIYFIAVVPLFLIPGLFGLIKAMAGDVYRYPLINRFLRR